MSGNDEPSLGETSPEEQPIVIEAVGVSKTYGSVRALTGVDLALHKGVVHGLLGANGAGKSTLVRILAGVERADRGVVRVEGEERHLTPTLARSLGVKVIYQDPQLVPRFTALQNLMLGQRLPRRAGLINWAAARERVAAAVDRMSLDFDLSTPTNELSVSQQWLLAITRALVGAATVVAMDEPTAALPAEAAEQVHRVVRDLADSGVAVLYITHRLDEVEALADAVTVLKDGQVSQRFVRGEFDAASLARAIVGGALPEDTQPVVAIERLEPVLQVRGLARHRAVRGVSFDLYPGEVLGFGGLVGSGRSEVARMIFGADRPDAGEMILDGEPYSPHNPRAAIRSGVAMVPEDRRSQGLVMNKSILANVALPDWSAFIRHRGVPMLEMSKARDAATEVVEQMQVSTPSVRQPVGRLSGGNQQKTLMGRWLRLKTKVLIVDEPTRGVDVGVRQEIHHIIRDLAQRGHAIILISSEFEELEICDRVIVLREGVVAGELTVPNVNEQRILELCFPTKAAV